jgi:nitrate/TMAO reductase-like tetraheme cytochrome c subunit
MSDSPSPSPKPPAAAAKPRSNFNNWISAVGGVIALGALFSFALLVWMDFTQGEKNPYLGIFTYLVAPAFLIGGIALAVAGAWAQRRWMLKHTNAPDRWRLDFTSAAQRRGMFALAAGALGFVILSAFGSYQTFHYSESNQFCGEVCHSAMHPEWVTYKRGAHARVNCVECHIGSGARWFIEAKLNGARQLVAFTFDKWNRPIDTPVHNLRPAQDTCEKCHWPEKFAGNVELVYDHFLSDKGNTPYSARMLMHVNTNVPGHPPGGIHWHVNPNERIEYFAKDDDRQDIPWMRVVNKKDGTSRVFRTDEFKGEPPADKVRVMDCIDCHNRPAHVFPTANEAVERSMLMGTLTRKLPNIKRVAVQAMTQKDITKDAEAPQKIADFMRAKYNGPEHAVELPGAIAAVQKVFAATIFVDRKADWRVYPNNIGHKDWPGCFRCHDDKHKTPQGQKVRSSDCNSCHTILSQGKGNDLELLNAKGLEFKHPSGELDAELTCADCHNGGIQK